MGRLVTSRGFTTPRPPHGNGIVSSTQRQAQHLPDASPRFDINRSKVARALAEDFFEAAPGNDPLCPDVEELGRGVEDLLPSGLRKAIEPQAELANE